MQTLPKGSSFKDALERDLNTIDKVGLRRRLRSVENRSGATIYIDGRSIVDFSSNDYLGLAGDRRIAAAATEFLENHHTGAAAARLISGNTPEHLQLERDIAELKGSEASLLFSSGYVANLGAISALVGKRDVVYSDELNHASLLDAIKLSKAEVRVFPHLDTNALRTQLQEDAGKFRRRLVAVDGVFSMDGDLFPLDQLVELAREFDAWTYVDDAHATAIIGENGRGTAEHFGVEGEIDVVMGTLGKSIGVSGAFVAGSQQLIDFLIHRARSFVFTTSTPAVLAVAASAAIRIANDEPWRRKKLRENAIRLRRGLDGIGRSAIGQYDSYIVPVMIGDVRKTVEIGAKLFDEGFLVGAVRPPSVPMGTSRLRLTVNAAQTDEEIDRLVEVLDRIWVD